MKNIFFVQPIRQVILQRDLFKKKLSFQMKQEKKNSAHVTNGEIRNISYCKTLGQNENMNEIP